MYEISCGDDRSRADKSLAKTASSSNLNTSEVKFRSLLNFRMKKSSGEERE